MSPLPRTNSNIALAVFSPGGAISKTEIGLRLALNSIEVYLAKIDFCRSSCLLRPSLKDAHSSGISTLFESMTWSRNSACRFEVQFISK